MSFRLKTVLGIAAIEFVLLAILILSGLYYIRSSNEARLFEQAHLSANLLATMTADATVSLDLATLDELTAQAARNPGIIYTRIRDAAGRVLSEAGDAAALSVDFNEDLSTHAAEVDGTLDVAAPIEIGGHVFGRVELGLGTARVAETVVEARDWMLGIAGAEIVLVAIFGLLLGQLLTVQLDRLRAAAHRVARGDFGFQTVISGRDELAETAISFNRMSLSLREYKEASERALETARRAQAKAENRLLEAIDAMPHGVAIVEDDGEIIHLNDPYFAVHGLTVDPGLAHSTLVELATLEAGAVEVLPYRADETAEISTRGAASLERIRRFEQADEYPHWETRLKDGRVLLCTQRRMVGGGLVLVDSDVTDVHRAAARMRDLERELMRKQKLESLGTLAGGVAHEINTPTQFIGDNIAFAREGFSDVVTCLERLMARLDDMGLRDRMADLLEEADLDYLREEVPLALDQGMSGVDRIRGIVSAVKVYSHPGDTRIEPVDVNRLVQSAAIVTKSSWKHVADLVEDLAPGPLMARVNEGQINQVLVNLIVNAADAIEEHVDRDGAGRIVVRTRAVDGLGVEITISDNGPGVPKASVDRIFDPFFTTKVVGKGSGQGLAISRSIIRDTHGGDLTLEKGVDGGATFRVFLPEDVSNKELAA
jgi:signal transduction histidine kinase/HAMP domain-containing protein